MTPTKQEMIEAMELAFVSKAEDLEWAVGDPWEKDIPVITQAMLEAIEPMLQAGWPREEDKARQEATKIIERIWSVWYGDFRGDMPSDKFAVTLGIAKQQIIDAIMGTSLPPPPSATTNPGEGVAYETDNQ